MQWHSWVDGAWTSGEQSVGTVINPATKETVAEVATAGIAEVNQAVASAKKAWQSGPWPRMAFAERAAALFKLADVLQSQAEDLIRWEVLQSGKPIKLVTYSDFPFALDNLRYFAGAGRVLEGQATQEYNGVHTSWIRREPVGVVAAIAPWNYPLMMAIWKIAPALAAGNTVVLKPASITPLTALLLGPAAKEAGIPRGVLNIIAGPGALVGDALVRHPDVAMISLTGDTHTGRKIMAQAASRVKRLHLELGGKAPAVVFDDAPLDAAIHGIAVAALVNSGQDCTAATRAYVHRKHYEQFLEGLQEVFDQARLGDPMQKDTDLGPLVSQAQWQKVTGYIEQAGKQGARIITAGRHLPGIGTGFYADPTILADVEQHWACVQEEIFGPVIAVMPFDTDEDVLAKANDVDYGLAASVWTQDLNRALTMSKHLAFGEVWLNDHLPLTSEMPHGGIKQSGFGHDLSRYALEEYTVVKHVMAEIHTDAIKPWHFTVLGDVPEE
ncbi:aminobutyraldehyde dehydrogenase [Sulfobacillus sp. hq2]|uniref:aminobutyraldehyde dehydrogenase n=1 Tax=Sulfobacillus sp. hq2 TaxID=2039167 RepID=UPI000CD21C6A|nr:aminobutyraldehyde dehydrogenase [Sulfobacillus sp. hq2]POB10510.1 gamma-aminobutyraldehyde dehydrogenase [Sulfobacillus sp. hq2]